MKAAAAIESESSKASVFKEIAQTQTEAGDIDGAKRAAAARERAEKENEAQEKIKKKENEAQEKIKEEVKSWTELDTEDEFSKPSRMNFPGLFEALKGKKPDEVVVALATAAGELGNALQKIQEKEAHWQKRR